MGIDSQSVIVGSNPHAGPSSIGRPGLRWCRLSLVLALVAICFQPLVSSADPGSEVGTEEKVKVALLYSLGKYIQWPEEKEETDQFSLCVLGEDPYGSLLDVLNGRMVRGKPLQVKRLDSFSGEQCHVLFVSQSEEEHLQDLLESCRRSNVLVVGDSEGFSRRGGAVNFRVVGSRISIEINRQAAMDAGLTVSARLLRTATVVETASEELGHETE